MNHKEFAGKVWKAVLDADIVSGGEDAPIAIIAAALEKQREACAEVVEDFYGPCELSRCVRGAEVEEEKE